MKMPAPARLAKGTSDGFTLIELMIVVGIVAMVMAMGIPAFVQAQNKSPLRQAVSDVLEVCHTARAQAILRGAPVDLRIDPRDYTFEVVPAKALKQGLQEADVRRWAEGANVWSMKLPSEVGIELIDVNFQPFKEGEATRVRFHSNGTSDEFTVVLRSLEGEIRKISLDPVTGRPDLEIIR